MNPSDQNENNAKPEWQYTSGNLVEGSAQALPDEPLGTEAILSDTVLMSWTASEFVEHEKTSRWYAVLVAGAIILATITFIITKQILSVIVVILMAVMFGVYGSAKPRVLEYAVMPSGLRVGDRIYPFTELKSFSVIEEGGMPYVQLLMQKRLSVPLVLYAAPDQIEQVAETLGQFVPYDQKKRDFADKISTRIRF